MPVKDTIQSRRGSSAQWSAANPILADGEIGYDSTTKQMKVGDGVTAWSGLKYANSNRITLQTASDAKILENLVINNGSPVVTSATANFTASDIGKTISVVDGLGAGVKALTTIVSRQSATQVTLATNMLASGTKACTYGTDDAPAIQAALNTMAVSNTGVLSLALQGHVFIASPVVMNFSDKINSLRLDLSEAVLHVSVPLNATAFTFSVLDVFIMEGGSVMGTPMESRDAYCVFRLKEMLICVIRDVHFNGLADHAATGGGTADGPGCIVFDRCKTEMSNCKFSSCIYNSSNDVSTVQVINWWGFRCVNCYWIDWARYNDSLTLSKQFGPPSLAWVHVNYHYTEGNPLSYYEYGKAIFEDCVFEEGAVYGVLARPYSGKKIEDVILKRCLSATADLGAGTGKAFYLFDVKNAVVEHCQAGWATLASDAITAVAVDNLRVSHCLFTNQTNTIRLTSVTDLVIENTLFGTVVGTATNSHIIRNGKGSATFTKAGAVSDADFPVAPCDGTLAIDTTYNRLYFRSGGAWQYIDRNVLPQNLLVNSEFSGAVAGTPGTAPTTWTRTIEGTVVTSVSLNAISATATSGRFVLEQSIPLVSGTYLFESNVTYLSGTAVAITDLLFTTSTGTLTYFVDGVETFSPVGGTSKLQIRIVVASPHTAIFLVGVGLQGTATRGYSVTNPTLRKIA
jgi:hypothetical protein